MMRRFLIAPSLALFLGLWMVGSGCSQQTLGGGGGGSGGNTPNPPTGVVDDSAGFYVRYVSDPKYVYDLHKNPTGFNTACTAVAGESADCYLDGEELDMYFHGVQLQYNVPSTLCTYVDFRSYWFIRYPVELSPAVVHTDTDKNGLVCYDANSNGVCEVGEAAAGCPYDYSGSKGPNCCQGDYINVQRTWDSSAGNYGTAVVSNATFAGKYGNCLSGPATLTHPLNDSGIPKSILSYVAGTGLNLTYDIKSPIQQDFASTVFMANFFDSADHGGGTNRPAGLTPSTAVNPSIYYHWRCLDRAEEVISEIRLHVREWNTKAMFDSRVTNPFGYDDTGAEPGPFGPTEQKNDRADWKDFDAAYPGLAL